MKKILLIFLICLFGFTIFGNFTNAQQTQYCNTPWSSLNKDTRNLLQPAIQYFGLRFGWMTYSYEAEGIKRIIASPEYLYGDDMKTNLYAFCLPSNYLVSDSEISIRKALEDGLTYVSQSNPTEAQRLWNIINQICGLCQNQNDQNLKTQLQNFVNSSEVQEKTSPVGDYLQLGRESWEAQFQEDTSCQADLNLGLWDFFHNPISWFCRLIFWVFLQILKLVADVFIYVLTPSNFGGFVKFQPVQQIWLKARDLANIGIILGFVFTAVATILKIEKYSWEKMLWRLVLVALLVNFSLVICGMFVDLSNFLTTFFITGAGSQTFGFKEILAYTASTIACAGHNKGYESASALIGTIVVIIFIGQVIGLILYTIVRIVTLWITLGLSPLFLLSLAFPGAEKLADTWKNYFTQAIVSLPIIAFSFYFVMVMLVSVALNFQSLTGEILTRKFIAVLSFGIIIIVLSQAILAIAGALGIKNIQKGYQWANKAIWGALGFVGGAALRGGAKLTVGSETYEKVAANLEKSPNRYLQRIGRTMRDTKSKVMADTMKREAEYLSNLNPDQTRRYIQANRNKFDKVALGINRLLELGDIDKKDIPYIEIAKQSRYLKPPSEFRKVNAQVYEEVFVSDDDKQKNKNAAINNLVSNNIDPTVFTNDKDLSMYQTISSLKSSDIANQNWDALWDDYFSQLTAEQKQRFFAGLALTQGTKLAPIYENARKHNLDYGRAILDGALYVVRKSDPTATYQHARSFLLNSGAISLPNGRTIQGKGLGGNAVFTSWINSVPI